MNITLINKVSISRIICLLNKAKYNNWLQAQSVRSLDVFCATAYDLRSKAAPEPKC